MNGRDDPSAVGMSIVRPADQGWKPAPDAELAHLRLCWGRWYQVAYRADSSEWAARHWPAAEQLIAGDALTIRRLIRDDWNARQPGPGWIGSLGPAGQVHDLPQAGR